MTQMAFFSFAAVTPPFVLTRPTRPTGAVRGLDRMLRMIPVQTVSSEHARAPILAKARNLIGWGWFGGGGLVASAAVRQTTTEGRHTCGETPEDTPPFSVPADSKAHTRI